MNIIITLCHFLKCLWAALLLLWRSFAEKLLLFPEPCIPNQVHKCGLTNTFKLQRKMFFYLLQKIL